MRAAISSALVLWLFVGFGCVRTHKEWGKVRALGTERTGYALDWDVGGEDSKIIENRVSELLKSELTEEKAVQIALLNNKMLQAQFEEIGIAKSELVEAWLPSNPRLEVEFRWPNLNSFTIIEGMAIWNIADLWMIPFHAEMETAQLYATLMDVADAVVHTAFQAKLAYLDLQIAVERRAYIAKHLQLFEQILTEVDYRYDFGLHNDFEVNLAAMNMHLQRIELARADAEVTRARARLNEVLSLKPKQFDYRFRPADFAVRVPRYEPREVLPFAYSHRLDVLVRQWNVGAAEARVDLEKARFLELIRVGVSYEQAPGQEVSVRRKGTDYESVKTRTVHNRSVGPGIAMEVPIWDWNQAQIAKDEYRYRQARKLLMVIKNQVRRELWEDMALIDFHATHAEIYRTDIEPLMVAAMEYTNTYFDAMRMNVLLYLGAVDNLVTAHRAYLQALRDLRAATLQLELHVGGRIPEEWYTDEVVTYRTIATEILQPESAGRPQQEAPDGPVPRLRSDSMPAGSEDAAQSYTVKIEIREDRILAPAEVPIGIIDFHLVNRSNQACRVLIEGPGTHQQTKESLAPDEERLLKIHLDAGQYTLSCRSDDENAPRQAMFNARGTDERGRPAP